MRTPNRDILEFGPFRIDPLNCRLSRNGETIPLKPKVFDTLMILVQNHGTVVSKDDLIERLWPDTAVEENNLTQNISALRKVLSLEGQQYIETIPKRGYRFTSNVRTILEFGNDDQIVESGYYVDSVIEKHTNSKVVIEHEQSPESLTKTRSVISLVLGTGRSRRLRVGLGLFAISVATIVHLYNSGRVTPPVTASIRSVAVLPFRTLTSNKEDEYLGMGFTYALVTKLAAVKGMVVRPTTAVQKYSSGIPEPKAICKEQKVEAIVEGSVQRLENRLRVCVQLISGETGEIIWTGNFDEKMEGVFRMQDLIWQSLADTFSLGPGARDRVVSALQYTSNIDAYHSYLKGRYLLDHFQEGGWRKAIEAFTQAISKDQSFALAYAGLAEAYWLSADWEMSSDTALQESGKFAQRAIQLDSDLAEAHLSLALVRLRHDWDWQGAESEFRLAIELAPGNAVARDWYGWYLCQMGRSEESIEQLTTAENLDPLSLSVLTDLGNYFYCTRQYEKSVEYQLRVLELDGDYWPAYAELGFTYLKTHEYEKAIQAFSKARALDTHPARLSALGFAYAVADNRKEASSILIELTRLSATQYVSPFDIALLHTGLGNRDLAFRWLDKAYAERSGWIIFIKNDPMFDDIRSDSRFTALLKRTGLAP